MEQVQSQMGIEAIARFFVPDYNGKDSLITSCITGVRSANPVVSRKPSGNEPVQEDDLYLDEGLMRVIANLATHSTVPAIIGALGKIIKPFDCTL